MFAAPVGTVGCPAATATNDTFVTDSTAIGSARVRGTTSLIVAFEQVRITAHAITSVVLGSCEFSAAHSCM